MAHTELERGAPFCENPGCALHVRVRDAMVEGRGNWPVTLEDDVAQELKRRRARQ